MNEVGEGVPNPDLQFTPEQDATDLQQVTNFLALQLENQPDLAQDVLVERQRELQSRPHLGSHTLMHAIVHPDQHKSRFAWIEVDKVIGRQSFLGGDWSTEMPSKTGKITALARSLSNPTPDDVEQLFRIKQKDEPIIAIAINGPAGPIYYIEDGTHRTVAAMVLGLKYIPVNLWQIGYPLVDSTYNKDLIGQWRTKLSQGYITGNLDTVKKPGEKGPILKTNLNVTNEVLPWARCPNGRGREISRVYTQVYPDSLNPDQYPIGQIFPTPQRNLKSAITGFFK